MSLKESFLVLDGSYYLYRTFHGSDLVYSFSGVPINAVRTSMATFRRVIENIQPSRIAVVFDSPEPTFRHALSDRYKSHRSPPPEELIAQLPYMKQAFRSLGVTVLEKSGFEGDDLVGTLATMGQEEGYFVIISTGDKDMMQLVDQGIIIENSFSDIRFGRENVKNKLGVYPEQVPDYLALVGDAADGIMGVQGIGAKTAAALLSTYTTIDGIIENLPNMSGKIPYCIGSSLEGLKLDRILTKIKTDVDIEHTMDDFKVKPMDRESIDALMEELGYIYGYRLLDIIENLVTE